MILGYNNNNNNTDSLTENDLLEIAGETGEAVATSLLVIPTDCFNVSSAVRWYVPPPSFSWTVCEYLVDLGFFTSLYMKRKRNKRGSYREISFNIYIFCIFYLFTQIHYI